ncbi:MAG: hypothetical protein C0395_00905 [Gemmatimonas sp.]|nr:hypothetical protein [Gemmatimonas sp.]
MTLFLANLGAIPAGVAAAPGGPVPYALAILALAAGLVWQIWRVRQRSRDLLDRQERARGLESLLAISARIHAFRDSEHLLNEITQSVRESLGFRMVLLRIYNVSDKVFEAKSFAGIDEEGIEYLRNSPMTLTGFRKMALPQFLISNSYLIRHTIEGAEQALADAYTQAQEKRAEGEWDERDALIIPLNSPEGEIRGYLSVDDPVDHKLPGLQTIQMLELFAQQAATAIASAELYSRLHRQNQELTRSSDRLRYHNELKNNFVANVSHELRTPLTSIKAYSEALVHGRERMDDAAQGEFLRVIQSESEKLTGIVNNLLDLERMEREQVTFNRHLTDLVALVRGIEGSARTQAETKRIAFTMHVDREEILLGVDADLVRQLIRHLLDNAFKFTPSGGKVHLSVVDGVSSVRIVVEDNGIGVPDNKLTYIFDRFYQVDGSSTREHGGQGIGLAICRDIVTRHGGRIWGERVQPQGVRFNALLPRRDEIVRRGQNNGRLTVFNDVPEFAERLIHWVGELLRARMVALLLPDAGGEHLVVEAAMGLEDRVVQDMRLARGEGIAGRVWATGEPALGEAAAAGVRAAPDRTGDLPQTGSLLSAPVMRDGRVVGVVNVASRLDGRPFGVCDSLLLQAIAARLGHVLERVVVHQRSNREFGDLAQALRKSVAIRRARHDELAELCHDICIDRPALGTLRARADEPGLRAADLRPGPDRHPRRHHLQGAAARARGVGDPAAARPPEPAADLVAGRSRRGARHRPAPPRAFRRFGLPAGADRRGHPPGRAPADAGGQPHRDAPGPSLPPGREPGAGARRDAAARRQPVLPALPGDLPGRVAAPRRAHRRGAARAQPGPAAAAAGSRG